MYLQKCPFSNFWYLYLHMYRSSFLQPWPTKYMYLVYLVGHASTYLSLSKMFKYAFYFHLHDKYMVQISHFPVFFCAFDFSRYLVISRLDISTKKIVRLEYDRLSDYLYKCQQQGLQNFFNSSHLSWLLISFSPLYGFHVFLCTWWSLITLSADSE